MRVLSLSGDPRSIGRQHGEQVADLRQQILACMQDRLAEVDPTSQDVSEHVAGMTGVWEAHAPGTLEMLKGMAEALDLEWADYFKYTIASYLDSRLKNTPKADGCTTWAAGGVITRDGAPLLAKNRDYKPDHLPLQCLARVRPSQGNPYICLTSAGSPGVFSSGMNIHGLAVADTHVASKDLGLGIGRYSLMMDLLENFDNVGSAIAYLHTRPHLGDGTVTLVDAQGNMAIFEIAHSVQAVRQSEQDYMVSTNHFIAPHTRTLWVDRDPPHLQGNSQARHKYVRDALEASKRQVDPYWAQALMAGHESHLSSICRHLEIDHKSQTISSIIFSPRRACLWVANGPPCETPYEMYGVAEASLTLKI